MLKKYVPVVVGYFVVRGVLSCLKTACPEIVQNFSGAFVAIGYVPILIGLHMLQKDSLLVPLVRRICRSVFWFVIVAFVLVTIMNLCA